MENVTQAITERLTGLGQGTWHLGESADKREQEIRTLRTGIDLGLTVIDTAEMYGDGRSEEVVGRAIDGVREEVFVIDKVLPSNATRIGTKEACERSLRRLGTDVIDLYLLHWRGDVPLQETLAGMADLLDEGKINAWGVSNFDMDDMQDLVNAGGAPCAANEVLYNLSRRGIEFDLMCWCQQRDIPIIAYSPIEQSRILGDETLSDIAVRHEATPVQIALAWAVRYPGVIAIPKASSEKHVRENAQALDITLTEEDLADLDSAFPAPIRKVPLEVI